MDDGECDHFTTNTEVAGYVAKAIAGSPTRFRGRLVCDCGKFYTEWFDLGEIKIPRPQPQQFSIEESQA
jgi:hypothetical protein